VALNDLSIAGAGRGSLLNNVVFSLERTAVREVFVNGESVIQDGRHALQDAVLSDFEAVQRRLWK
jgi:cytosine/adenosine deaminase-related metal-dependent hydrolase